MAHDLAEKYDVGVGIAKGGLELAYMIHLFGLDTRVVESHSRYRDKVRKKSTFQTQDNISNIEGKRVLVLENDTVRGLTLKRVGDELKKYSPSVIDVAFIHNPVTQNSPIGTNAGAIPFDVYDKAYFPKDFSYASFGSVIRELEKRLE